METPFCYSSSILKSIYPSRFVCRLAICAAVIFNFFISNWMIISSKTKIVCSNKAAIGWMEWSSLPELRVVRDSGEVVNVTPEKWKDVFRYAIGGSYDVSRALTLRAGIAYDGTEVPDSTRTPRLPDPARTWLAVGARWQPTESIVIDFGYAHLFSDDAPLDQDAGNAAAYGLVNGMQESATDIVSTQFVYRF